MKNHLNFRLEVAMLTPAIIQGALTLESLLAARVHEMTGKIRDEALAMVPINRISVNGSDIWLASSAYFGGAVSKGKETIIRRRRNTEMGPDFYEPNTRARKDQFACAQDKGDYKALLNSYTTTEAEKLVWFGNGDAEQCVEMIRGLMWIGKRRGQGFGQIAGVQAFETDENPLLDADGLVRRPIDAKDLAHIPGAAPAEKQYMTFASVAHPSWAHPPVLCAIPEHRDIQLTLKKVAEVSEDGFFEG